MNGIVVLNSGNDIAAQSRVIGKTISLANFKRWCKMSGSVSKGHYGFIPIDDTQWGVPQRTFSLTEDDLIEITHVYN